MDCIDVLLPDGADPFPMRGADGLFYLTMTTGNNVSLWRGRSIEELGRAERKTIWNPLPSGMASKNIWAPELHFLRGAWYVYFAADDGRNENHRMFAVKNTSKDPFSDNWQFVGKVADETDRWAIDGTVLEHEKRLYFIWSGWEGTENTAQNLYIAPMSDPATISGQRVLISSPTEPWEKHGSPLVNEGPEVLKCRDRVHIIYSASGSWTNDYCLGQLTLKPRGNPLSPTSWYKYKAPVFSSGNGIMGPGHAGFVTDAHAKNWIVYHAAKFPGAGWNRFVRTQTFDFDKEGNPLFGIPAPRK